MRTANDKRAAEAHKAMKYYRQDNEDPEALIDMLTDLLHWADKHQVDFDDRLRVARMHHRVETGADRPKASPFPVGPHDKSWLG